jgi:hypothetical protein
MGAKESHEAKGTQAGSSNREHGTGRLTTAMFIWLISHQPAVLFSLNKPVISN